MQLLSCRIAVAGDDLNVVVREHDTAVTYPELLVIKALHGSESVREVEDVGDVDRSPEEERDRLKSIYGNEIVRQVFPGEHQPVPTQDTRMRAANTVFDAPDDKAEDKPEDKASEDKPAPKTKAR
jgi:hypothetical protein